MRHLDTSGPKTYPQLVFCRTDFLKVVEKTWKQVHELVQGIDASKLREYCTLEDISENARIAYSATYGETMLNSYGSVPLPIVNSTPETESLTPLFQFDGKVDQVALHYLYGKELGVVDDFAPFQDQFKMLVKGSFLFVGIEPGFVVHLGNKAKEREFLINCLEMCRTAMQDPALTASPLYRRFVFTNVNV